MWLTATRAGVGGKVVDGREPRLKGRRSPHHRVMSGTSYQDNHSPDVQAKVKIKSLEESAERWPHPTGHAVGYEGL